MPNSKKYHPLRVPKELETRLKARAKSFRSVNAYILHCIELEIAHVDACEHCTNREIADSVRHTIQLANKSEVTNGAHANTPYGGFLSRHASELLHVAALEAGLLTFSWA